MTVSYFLDSPGKQTEDIDVAIIGGGIVGACAAYWLSKRTGLKTVILEERKRAWGASGRNGGFVLRGLMAYYDEAVARYGRQVAREIHQFNESTQAYLAEFAENCGERFDYDRCGSYLLACSLEELQHLEASATLMAEDGFQVEYVMHDPLKRDYYGAIFNQGDAAVNAARLVDVLIEKSGARIYEGQPVYRMETLSDGRVEVESTDYRLRCDRVLLCTNAYAALMEAWFIGKIQPVRGQALVTKPLKKRILDRLCYANYGYEYFRQLPDGRLLLGGCREPFVADEASFSDAVTGPVQSALHHYLRDRFPEAAGIGIDYRWSGLMAFTADGLPLLGQLVHQSVVTGSAQRPVTGAYYAVGCNGHGLGFSFALSKLLVEMALDGADAGIFAASRLESAEQKKELAGH